MKYKILMSPEYGKAIFWDDYGGNIGGYDSLFIEDDQELDLSSIIGLDNWFREWEEETLWQTHHCADMQWKEWWEKGLILAKEIKLILPENVELYYFSLKEPIWIARPEESDDGGLFNYGEPIKVV